jgi:hypothetical protein
VCDSVFFSELVGDFPIECTALQILGKIEVRGKCLQLIVYCNAPGSCGTDKR